MGDLRPGEYVRVDGDEGEWVGRIVRFGIARAWVRGPQGAEWVRNGRYTKTDRPTHHPGRATQTANHELATGVPQPKTQPLRDRDYLAWIRKHPCKFCEEPAPSEASHHGRGGMATKAGDDTVIPACSRCHARWHSKEYSPHPMLDGLTPEARRDVLRVIAADFRQRYEREVLHG